MKSLPFILLVLVGSGCASGPGAFLRPQGPGQSGPHPSAAVVEAAARDPIPTDSPGPPSRIAIPADYKLMLVDGGLELVRDDAPGGMAVHLGAGHGSAEADENRPELLPQELAAEVARNRASSARLESALQLVMERSRELEEQAQTLGSQSKRMADLLAAAQPKAAPVAAKNADPDAR